MIDVERHGPVAVLHLNRPKVNALSPGFLQALLTAVGEVERDEEVGALVLASRSPKTFSAGFDLKEISTLPPERFCAFIGDFARLYRALFAGRVPVVAAVGGHAVAGGAILALACDRRVFAEGPGRFGLSEVDLGLPLPPGVLRLLRAAVTERVAYEAACLGRLYAPAEAREAGFADRLVPAAECLEAALAEARALAAKPRQALGALRHLVRGAAERALEEADEGAAETFHDWWQSPEASARRQALLASLEARG
ncbi:MAG: enoyl-CoA hydratase/isomerase family protein [Deferrisomatales bacterium]